MNGVPRRLVALHDDSVYTRVLGELPLTALIKLANTCQYSTDA